MNRFSVTVGGGFGGRPGQYLSCYASNLSDAERAIAERDSGVKHARLLGSAACFAALAGRELLQRIGPRETGLICTGGPWALAANSAFIDRAGKAGPELINPLQFPATLVSATATAVGSLLHAHAFACVIGHDRLAFFEALRRASSSIRHGFAAQVLVLAPSSSDSFIEAARKRAGIDRPSLDVSIGFGIGSEGGRATLQLLGAYVDSSVPRHHGESYEANWCGDTFAYPIDTPLATGEAYGASGALLCLTAAQHHARAAKDPTAAFSVSAHAEGRSATAIFQFIGEPNEMFGCQKGDPPAAY